MISKIENLEEVKINKIEESNMDEASVPNKGENPFQNYNPFGGPQRRFT